MKIERIIVLVGLALVVLAPTASAASDASRIYWHFTFKAFVHLPDLSAQEWAWVTMVEFDKARAYPDEAATARRHGGRLQGTVLAQVRGAAWRSAHRYEADTRCHDRPAKKQIFWEASDSVGVYCHGMFFTPRPYRDDAGSVVQGPDMFRFGFTNRKILHENGEWEDLRSRPYVFVGPIHIEGTPREETRGNFHLQVVNYADDLEHHRRCEDAWVEQHNTAFDHFNHDNLEDDIPAVGESLFGQVPYGPRDRNNIVWTVDRSRSREHPHWKEQTM